MLARAIAGVEGFRIDGLERTGLEHTDPGRLLLVRAQEILDPPDTVEISVRGETLTVMGTAPRSWIESARELWRGIEGVAQYVDNGLINSHHRVA